jgi:hypothetical protein
MSNISERPDIRKQRPIALIPRKLLPQPPIRHRHTASKLHYLWPGQFAVAVAVVDAARLAHADTKHRLAMAAGARAIEHEQELDRKFTADLTALNKKRKRGQDAAFPQRKHSFNAAIYYETENMRAALQPGGSKYDRRGEPTYNEYRPPPRGRTFKRAGRERYRKVSQQQRKTPPPDLLTVKISGFQLLRRAGVPTNGVNYQRLEDTLQKLTRRIGEHGPLLESWALLPSGRYRLVIYGHWLSPPFAQVSWPPPSLRAPTALALYLFLHAINTHPSNKQSMWFDDLLALLGISTTAGMTDANRTFNRNLDVVNAHLQALDRDALDDLRDRRGKLGNGKIAAGYRVEPGDEDGRVKIVRMPYQRDFGHSELAQSA